LTQSYARTLLLQSLKETLPILPNGWLENYSLKHIPFPMTPNGSGPWGQPRGPLPTDFLDLRGVEVAEPRAVVRLFYSFNEYQAAKSQMTLTTLGEYLFIQQGGWLEWWPQLAQQKAATISYVSLPTEPTQQTDNFYCPDRALDIVIDRAAANFKVGDISPDQAAALLRQRDATLAMAMGLQAQKVADDPFVVKRG